MTQTNGDLLRTLDRLPAEIRSLTLAVASEANVDLAMALITLLSGMGAAVHGIRAVARPDRTVESLGLFHILLAGTTSGKQGFIESYMLRTSPTTCAASRNILRSGTAGKDASSYVK